MIRYSTEIDEALLVESAERFRAQSAGRFGRYGLKIICALGLGIFLMIALWARVWVVAVVVLLFVGLLLVGPRIDFWLMKRRLRMSPFYRQRLEVCLSPEGFSEVGKLSKTELAWAAFTGVVRVEDGFLIFSGPKVFHWLPDRALIEGDLSQAESLLREHIESQREDS